MKQYSILTILVVFLSTAVIVSCQKDRELLPGPINNGSPTHPTAYNGPIDLSPVSGTDKVFYFLQESTYPISCNWNTGYCTLRSRFILHNDNSFLLQYNYDEGNEYRRGIQYAGRYTQTYNNVSFTWQGWSAAGPWGATGSLRGDTLTVEYNIIMSLSDFEDAVYLGKR